MFVKLCYCGIEKQKHQNKAREAKNKSKNKLGVEQRISTTENKGYIARLVRRQPSKNKGG